MIRMNVLFVMLLLCLAAGAAWAQTPTTQPNARPGMNLVEEDAQKPSTDPLTDPNYVDPKLTEPIIKEPIDIPVVKQAVEFIEKTKHPVNWFTWGGDLRLREVYMKNPIMLNNHTPPPSKGGRGNEWHYQRYRTRLWSTVTPVKNIEFNSRIVWEFRTWEQPKGILRNNYGGGDFQQGDVVFDQLNIKATEFLGLPLTLTVGRQDMKINDGWLVLDGTPNDGSRTIYFDAVRAQWQVEPIKTSFDLSYINQPGAADGHIQPFNPNDIDLANQNSQGVVLNVVNESFEDHDLGGYFIYQMNNAINPRGDSGDLYTFGLRAVGEFCDKWTYAVQGAYQFGNKNGRNVNAFGGTGNLMYHFEDAWDNQLGVQLEYLSGDDPHSGTDESFDVLWGKYPQFSELYAYTWIGETGSYGDATNLQRVGMVWTTQPTKSLIFKTAYQLLWANQNTNRGMAGFSKQRPVPRPAYPGHHAIQVHRPYLRPPHGRGVLPRKLLRLLTKRPGRLRPIRTRLHLVGDCSRRAPCFCWAEHRETMEVAEACSRDRM